MQTVTLLNNEQFFHLIISFVQISYYSVANKLRENVSFRNKNRYFVKIHYDKELSHIVVGKTFPSTNESVEIEISRRKGKGYRCLSETGKFDSSLAGSLRGEGKCSLPLRNY